ncbi:MAG: hypothetical protein M1371_11930 [Actinobacteria bacterium]|nr:hypothetical protein [Actinomycetota bacterium]
MSLTKKELENIEATLGLEYGANRRYEYQQKTTFNPRINTFLEGLQRTEGDHIEWSFSRLKENQPKNKVDGWSSILFHLRTDLEFEKKATSFYELFTSESTDPEVKKAFDDLARSEAGHVNILSGLIAEIEEGKFPVLFYCKVCGWELDFGLNPKLGTITQCGKCATVFELGIEKDDFKIKRLEDF